MLAVLMFLFITGMQAQTVTPCVRASRYQRGSRCSSHGDHPCS